MKTLKLVLKRKWYDMISSGEKKEEYREISPYWKRQIMELRWWEPFPRVREFDSVTFYLGYAKDRPSMTFKIEGISVGEGREDWGAEPGKKYFVIKLGERI